jgi:hypothetical protein
MESVIISYVEIPSDYWVISTPGNIEIEYINSEEE